MHRTGGLSDAGGPRLEDTTLSIPGGGRISLSRDEDDIRRSGQQGVFSQLVRLDEVLDRPTSSSAPCSASGSGSPPHGMRVQAVDPLLRRKSTDVRCECCLRKFPQQCCRMAGAVTSGSARGDPSVPVTIVFPTTERSAADEGPLFGDRRRLDPETASALLLLIRHEPWLSVWIWTIAHPLSSAHPPGRGWPRDSRLRPSRSSAAGASGPR